MRVTAQDIGGEVAKEDERYTVVDNTTLNGLVVSSTRLYKHQSTSGHSHAGQEEVYHFITGWGKMDLADETFDVRAGDIVLIPDGAFHRVHAARDTGMYFICVFDGKRNHK
jgi:mannose-6-phosphate isomerase-like protein (cupin superfamily)